MGMKPRSARWLVDSPYNWVCQPAGHPVCVFLFSLLGIMAPLRPGAKTFILHRCFSVPGRCDIARYHGLAAEDKALPPAQFPGILILH